MSVQTLKNICIENIIENIIENGNEISLVNRNLQEEFDLLKHKRAMQKTLDLLDKIYDSFSKSNIDNITLYRILYLKAEDFFSYDHLLIQYSKIPKSKSFKFIQL
jgi:hypothetical protein